MTESNLNHQVININKSSSVSKSFDSSKLRSDFDDASVVEIDNKSAAVSESFDSSKLRSDSSPILHGHLPSTSENER